MQLKTVYFVIFNQLSFTEQKCRCIALCCCSCLGKNTKRTGPQSIAGLFCLENSHRRSLQQTKRSL